MRPLPVHAARVLGSNWTSDISNSFFTNWSLIRLSESLFKASFNPQNNVSERTAYRSGHLSASLQLKEKLPPHHLGGLFSRTTSPKNVSKESN